jgi:hypothetical protein
MTSQQSCVPSCGCMLKAVAKTFTTYLQNLISVPQFDDPI